MQNFFIRALPSGALQSESFSSRTINRFYFVVLSFFFRSRLIAFLCSECSLQIWQILYLPYQRVDLVY